MGASWSQTTWSPSNLRCQQFQESPVHWSQCRITQSGWSMRTGHYFRSAVSVAHKLWWLLCYKTLHCSGFFVTVAVLQEYRVSALTLLVGCQEEYLALKNWVMRYWCDYLSGARSRFRLFAVVWSGRCHWHPKVQSSLVTLKSRMDLPFWYWLFWKEAVKWVCYVDWL